MKRFGFLPDHEKRQMKSYRFEPPRGRPVRAGGVYCFWSMEASATIFEKEVFISVSKTAKAEPGTPQKDNRKNYNRICCRHPFVVPHWVATMTRSVS